MTKPPARMILPACPAWCRGHDPRIDPGDDALLTHLSDSVYPPATGLRWVSVYLAHNPVAGGRPAVRVMRHDTGREAVSVKLTPTQAAAWVEILTAAGDEEFAACLRDTLARLDEVFPTQENGANR